MVFRDMVIYPSFIEFTRALDGARAMSRARRRDIRAPGASRRRVTRFRPATHAGHRRSERRMRRITRSPIPLSAAW